MSGTKFEKEEKSINTLLNNDKAIKTADNKWYYSSNYFTSVEQNLNSFKALYEENKSKLDEANAKIKNCFKSEKKEELKKAVESSASNIGGMLNSLIYGINGMVSWMEERKSRNPDSPSMYAVNTYVASGYSGGNTNYSSNSTSNSRVENISDEPEINPIPGQNQENPQDVEIEDKSTLQKEINSLIDQIVNQTETSNKDEIKKEITKKIEDILDQTSLENKDEIKQAVENKLQMLLDATTVEEKNKIAEEVKSDINLIVETANVIDDKNKQIEELKNQKADIPNQAEIKEIDEKMAKLIEEKEQVEKEVALVNAQLGDKIAEKSEELQNTEPDSQEEAQLQKEIEELTNQMIENDNNAEERTMAIDKEIEELENQKKTMTEEKEKEIEDNIAKLENDVKQANSDLVEQLKGEQQAETNTETDNTNTIKTDENGGEGTTAEVDDNNKEGNIPDEGIKGEGTTAEVDSDTEEGNIPNEGVKGEGTTAEVNSDTEEGSLPGEEVTGEGTTAEINNDTEEGNIPNNETEGEGTTTKLDDNTEEYYINENEDNNE